MAGDLRRGVGTAGEAMVARHYEVAGYEIVDRNWRCREGELDLVVRADGLLVFCEVKTRREGGRPWESLPPRKRRQVRRMVAAYLATVEDRPRVPHIRIDAIGVVVDSRDRLLALDHLEGAI